MTNPLPHNLTLDDLLPHRDRMLLIGEVLDVSETGASTRTVAGETWPFVRDGQADPMVLVELVAQTAGLNNSVNRIRTRGKEDGNMGWIVGIKKADFHMAAIPLGSRIVTRTTNRFSYENFQEITGTVTVNGTPAADVVLQLMSA